MIKHTINAIRYRIERIGQASALWALPIFVIMIALIGFFVAACGGDDVDSNTNISGYDTRIVQTPNGNYMCIESPRYSIWCEKLDG